jgi:hypothetical protein
LKGGTPKLPGGGSQARRCVFAIHSKRFAVSLLGVHLRHFQAFVAIYMHA